MILFHSLFNGHVISDFTDTIFLLHLLLFYLFPLFLIFYLLFLFSSKFRLPIYSLSLCHFIFAFITFNFLGPTTCFSLLQSTTTIKPLLSSNNFQHSHVSTLLFKGFLLHLWFLSPRFFHGISTIIQRQRQSYFLKRLSRFIKAFYYKTSTRKV